MTDLPREHHGPYSMNLRSRVPEATFFFLLPPEVLSPTLTTGAQTRGYQSIVPVLIDLPSSSEWLRPACTSASRRLWEIHNDVEADALSNHEADMLPMMLSSWGQDGYYPVFGATNVCLRHIGLASPKSVQVSAAFNLCDTNPGM